MSEPRKENEMKKQESVKSTTKVKRSTRSPMMMTICKRFHFDAAHYLPEYEGKCHNLHGHRWNVDVALRGPVQIKGSQKGMVADFTSLKNIVNERVIDQLDHTCLNDILCFDPTAELLARWIYMIIQTAFSKTAVKLEFIRVWETEDAYAEYKEVK